MDQWTLGTGMQQSYPGTIVEAMGLFSDLLANQKFNPERQRQGLCPDFLIPESNRTQVRFLQEKEVDFLFYE